MRIRLVVDDRVIERRGEIVRFVRDYLMDPEPEGAPLRPSPGEERVLAVLRERSPLTAREIHAALVATGAARVSPTPVAAVWPFILGLERKGWVRIEGRKPYRTVRLRGEVTAAQG